MSALPTWRDRVTAELADLNNRAALLTTFIGRAPVFTMLPTAQQVLMRAQLDVMRAYAGILVARLAVPDAELPTERA